MLARINCRKTLRLKKIGIEWYYLKKYVALLIRKTINAVTVMLAVMEIIQKIINAVTVIPVEMYQTISKHIMFRCHCRFLLEI